MVKTASAIGNSVFEIWFTLSRSSNFGVTRSSFIPQKFSISWRGCFFHISILGVTTVENLSTMDN